jgi:hypothetical protein
VPSDKCPYVAMLGALLLTGCATTQRQLHHSLSHATARTATYLCRAFGYADADTRTVCTPYLR